MTVAERLRANQAAARSLAGGRVVAPLLLAFIVGVSTACGGSGSTTPNTAVVTISPGLVAPWPPGGSAAPELIGTWRQVISDQTLVTTMTLTANTYHLSNRFGEGSGNIVVNGNEIDFFNNGNPCRLPLPGGVGRYRWSLHGSTLSFAPLNTDPCGRIDYLLNQSYARTAP